MNRSMTRSTLCAIAIASAIGGSLIAVAPAAFAAKAVLVQSADEPGRVPYQESMRIRNDSVNCPLPPSRTNFYCVARFPAVPPGMRLVVTHVSADYSRSVPAEVALVRLGMNASLDFTLALPVPVQVANGRFGRFVVSSSVTFFVNSGDSPSVFLMAASSDKVDAEIHVVLVGYLVSLP